MGLCSVLGRRRLRQDEEAKCGIKGAVLLNGVFSCKVGVGWMWFGNGVNVRRRGAPGGSCECENYIESVGGEWFEGRYILITGRVTYHGPDAQRRQVGIFGALSTSQGEKQRDAVVINKREGYSVCFQHLGWRVAIIGHAPDDHPADHILSPAIKSCPHARARTHADHSSHTKIPFGFRCAI